MSLRPLIALGISFALGCGVDNGELLPDPEDGGELGTYEQPYIGVKSATKVPGTCVNCSGLSQWQACSRTDNTKLCTIPRYKRVEVAIGSGWDSTETQRILGLLSQFGVRHTTWQFALGSTADNIPNGWTRLVFSKGQAADSDGVLSVGDIAQPSFGAGTPLTEGQTGNDPEPSYQSHMTGSCVLDQSDIAAHDNDIPAVNVRLWQQAYGNCLDVFMGVGRNASNAGYYSQTALNQTQNALSVATNCEKARADYLTGNETDFSLNSVSCSSSGD